MARAIRPFLEGWLRFRFPLSFPTDKWLGDFIVLIKKADATDDLYHAKTFIDEIESINDYSKKFHHGPNPNGDSENVSITELNGYVKRTLELIKK